LTKTLCYLRMPPAKEEVNPYGPEYFKNEEILIQKIPNKPPNNEGLN